MSVSLFSFEIFKKIVKFGKTSLTAKIMECKLSDLTEVQTHLDLRFNFVQDLKFSYDSYKLGMFLTSMGENLYKTRVCLYANNSTKHNSTYIFFVGFVWNAVKTLWSQKLEIYSRKALKLWRLKLHTFRGYFWPSRECRFPKFCIFFVPLGLWGVLNARKSNGRAGYLSKF